MKKLIVSIFLLQILSLVGCINMERKKETILIDNLVSEEIKNVLIDYSYSLDTNDKKIITMHLKSYYNQTSIYINHDFFMDSLHFSKAKYISKINNDLILIYTGETDLNTIAGNKLYEYAKKNKYIRDWDGKTRTSKGIKLNVFNGKIILIDSTSNNEYNIIKSNNLENFIK